MARPPRCLLCGRCKRMSYQSVNHRLKNRRDAVHWCPQFPANIASDAIYGVPTGFIHAFVMELSFMCLPWLCG